MGKGEGYVSVWDIYNRIQGVVKSMMKNLTERGQLGGRAQVCIVDLLGGCRRKTE